MCSSDLAMLVVAACGAAPQDRYPRNSVKLRSRDVRDCHTREPLSTLNGRAPHLARSARRVQVVALTRSLCAKRGHQRRDRQRAQRERGDLPHEMAAEEHRSDQDRQ